MDKLLDKINSPKDLKKLSLDQLNQLAEEIRKKEIEVVSKNGGHLASNLGVVELTIAMHKVFDSPKDQIVFDVGHQCYAHKILTGRLKNFDFLRKKDGISGFPKPSESEHDIFYSGHSGTSVSSGIGLAQAKKMNDDDHYVISVIGDGSFTCGMVYEAMNNGGRTNNKHIIVLNDNKMSISENVGSFAKYLAIVRSSTKYYNLKDQTEQRLNSIPAIGRKISQLAHNIKTDVKNTIYPQSTFFEDLGYRYIGPVDGHNIKLLIMGFEAAKKVNGPVILHVLTTKGKGYDFAEKEPSIFHGISEFDIFSGEPIPSSKSFSSCLGALLVECASKNQKLCAVTAAMSLGTGLEDFKSCFPERFFDVGIAEEHAVTFSSGLAKNGLIPVFAVYSTFFQRCYDQLIHDVSLQKVKVIFAIDRCGFVGDDGETHNGLFDVAFLNTIPFITVYSPCCFRSLKADFNEAVNAHSASVAIRYPRGCQNENVKELIYNQIEYSTFSSPEYKTVIVTYGRLTSQAIEAVKQLNECFLVSLNQIKPIPDEVVELLLDYDRIFFFEEGILSGGVGQTLASRLLEKQFKGSFRLTAVNDDFVAPATYEQLLDEYGLSSEKMVKTVKGLL